MPKLGMEPVRRRALIDATIAEIGDKGSLDITVAAIARRAGVSAALAHHYFGGKNHIFLATMTHILDLYGREARAALKQAVSPKARLAAIVSAGFTGDNFHQAVITAWMNFYALALSSAEAARLLSIYQRRLRSNLRHALRPLVDDAAKAAERIAALIDGLYLREGLSRGRNASRAVEVVLQQIDMELKGAAQ